MGDAMGDIFSTGEAAGKGARCGTGGAAGGRGERGGRVPWAKEREGSDARMKADLLRRIIEGARLEMPNKCPEAVKGIIRDCFQGDPMKRPTMDALCERLAEVQR